jgi:hypothetical protein
MPRKNKIVQNMSERYIKGTVAKAIVEDIYVFLCHLTFAVTKANKFKPNVYLSTKVLKHIYDKRPAEEYDFIIESLYKIVRYPDVIYKNKDPKRGDYVFTKIVGDCNYFCSLEACEDGFNVVTVFRLRKENYLKNYDSIWSWRAALPHRNIFVASRKRTTHIPQ